MFENTKVIKDFVLAEVLKRNKRKQYSFENTKHSKREAREEVYKMAVDLSNHLVKSSGIKLTVKGIENLEVEGPIVYVASHKSVFDIVILLTLIKQPTIFIGKKELKSVPFVHSWFDALGCIYIDRDNMRDALKSILQGIEEIKHGQSIVLFPEGTRNMSNEIQEFKEGGFKLATKTKVPIIPIALSNTYKIFEEKGRIQRTEVTVNIGEKIEIKEYTKEQLSNLPKQMEEEVKRLMREIQC